MAKTSNRWIKRHVHDPYVQSSQKVGYRSRAAYKLIELVDKYADLPAASRVLDLGAAPGGWSQVLRQKLAASAQVVALDRLPMPPIAGVDFIQGDFTEQETLDRLLNFVADDRFDWIFSDMAPNISGIKARDQAECHYLIELVFDLCHSVLKPGGAIIVKVFQGTDFNAIRAQALANFNQVRTIKPKASRDASSEVYLLATGYNNRTPTE